MNISEIELINASWDRVSEKKHRLIQRLYENFIEDNPDLISLFISSPEITQVKFGEMLYSIIHSVRDLRRMKPILESLGKVHKERGVDIKHYYYFYTSFYEAYNEISARPLTTEEAAAWETVFDELSILMQFPG